MLSPSVLIAVCCLYMAFLFMVALRVEHQAAAGTNIGNNAVIYALSLSIFPTAWSFYGSVGKAASTGMWFISFHLGSTLAVILWWIVLRKMVRIKNRYRITSIADFISLRYNKSASIAALVTVIAILGMVPYIALQLKAVFSTFRVITGFQASHESSWSDVDIGLIITGIIILFTIILGVRRLVPTERHQGIVVAMAAEGMVKLIALLAVGAYVTYGLFGGMGDIFTRFAQSPHSQAIASIQTTPSFYVTWTTHLLLAMSAVMFLPRQFHMEVVENFEEKHIQTAMWLFPLYMFLMNIFILPIALGGLLIGYPADSGDSFVLNLPLSSGKPFLSLLVFLGGFSAGTGMITISSMTISTMVTNHLLLPFMESVKPLDFIKRHLLQCRWITVAALILSGYWFEQNVGAYFPLVDIGTISFTAVLQFAPAILGGLFWKRGNTVGALLGLSSGFLVWIYTLILPAFAKGGFISQTFLTSGPAGIGILMPEQLLGVTSLDPTSHAVLWTLLFNVSFYILGSLYIEQGEEERGLAAEFVDALAATGPVRLGVEATIDLAEKKQHVEKLFRQYFPAAKAIELTEQCLAVLHLDNKGAISIIELAELYNEAENRLAGSFGAAAAHKAIHRTAVMTSAEEGALKRVYGEIIAELKLSPSDLKTKIDYYRERERLLTAHATELEEKVAERDNEIAERRKAEEALRNSETRLTDMINFLPDATFVVDLEGKIIIWNRAAEEYTGRTAEEMLGKGNHEHAIPFYGIRRPILADLVLESSAEVEKLYPYFRRAGETIIGESYIRSTKHGDAYVFGIAAPLYDSKGNITGAIESIHDITERKKAEIALLESERKFRAIFDETFQFIGLMALDGTVLEVNKTALRFGGLEESDVVGRPFWETQWWAHSTELQEKLRAAVKMAAGGEFMRFETNHPAADGTPHFFDFSVKPVRDEAGNIVLLIPEGRDITERKEMEQMKDEMISAVSHEMRTPLTAMMGYTEFMLDNEIPMDQQKEYLQIILRETGRLSELIDNFLDLQRFRSRGQALTCQPLPLQPLLEEATALFAGVSQRHHLTLDCPLDLPQVCGHEKHLRQVFNNLVSNAVKYSPKGGEVKLAARREKDRVVVSVSDEGIGIPPQALQRIFERFYRVDNTARREFGGTGLGLSLVREIVAAHGGNVWVESTLGQGSTFFVSLPVA